MKRHCSAPALKGLFTLVLLLASMEKCYGKAAGPADLTLKSWDTRDTSLLSDVAAAVSSGVQGQIRHKRDLGQNAPIGDKNTVKDKDISSEMDQPYDKNMGHIDTPDDSSDDIVATDQSSSVTGDAVPALDVDKRHLGSAMSRWLKQKSFKDGIGVDKKHLGSAMSGWLKDNFGDAIQVDKKHLGSAMSGWLRDNFANDIHVDKKHLGSAMSGWLKDNFGDAIQVDKKHLGSAMSGWLRQKFNDGFEVDKKHLGSAMSGWLQDHRDDAMETDKRHMGSAMSNWLQQYRDGGIEVDKKHLGSAMSSWLKQQKYRTGKRHMGSAMSGWLTQKTGMTYADKKNLGSAQSNWLRQYTGRQSNKRDDPETSQGPPSDEGQADAGDREKKHLGSAMSSWLLNKNGNDAISEGKRHMGSAMSGLSWHQNQVTLGDDIDKRHLGSAMSGWLAQHRWQGQGKRERRSLPDTYDDLESDQTHHITKRSTYDDTWFDEQKRHLGAAINRGQNLPYDLSLYPLGYHPGLTWSAELQQPVKRHLGSAVSRWLMRIIDDRNKRLLRSAISF